jgi:hypothetical protein
MNIEELIDLMNSRRGMQLTDGHIFFDTVATSCHNSRRSYVKASNS